MKETFEEMLERRFIERGEWGGRAITKDNAEDLFSSWLERMDSEDFLELGQKFAEVCYTQGKLDGINSLTK